ncbi:unnamed protein product [Cuscuta campestris]|uniref:Glycosyltransferase n=1 Tax=Cuscuta campestris TaxID=132261 RepID=A0A484M9I1_9ASTE|nr:unnamed protein product [Cuscuta campestris]
MGSVVNSEVPKPHAVCVPYPAQGHINPMLKLAKVLHHRGFHITFVHSEFNHRRLLRSRGPDSLRGSPSFRFETIPDGLPPSDADATQDIPSLCRSTSTACLLPFMELLTKLNKDSAAASSDAPPPVSCIVSDGVMSFTVAAAEQLGVPEVLFWTPSACGFLGYMHYSKLVDLGYTPLKDESCLTNGHLETKLDCVEGMKGIRLRDLPSFVRTTDPNDFMVKYFLEETERAKKASAIVINTFDALEHEALASLRSMLPPIYDVGPLQLLLENEEDDGVKTLASNLWKEDATCLDWLGTKRPNSVVYINFGSITVMTTEELVEFAWGLANSDEPFLWVIRPDLVTGEGAMLPPEFVEETKDRGMLSSWCPQEQVLAHPAVGGFLTHSGWNSTLESICNGVPMLCWPFFADQPTNCRFSCVEWGVGMEIDGDVKREVVEGMVRELMEGEKGEEMRRKAMEWKKLAQDAGAAGSSYKSIDKFIKHLKSH